MISPLTACCRAGHPKLCPKRPPAFSTNGLAYAAPWITTTHSFVLSLIPSSKPSITKEYQFSPDRCFQWRKNPKSFGSITFCWITKWWKFLRCFSVRNERVVQTLFINHINHKQTIFGKRFAEIDHGDNVLVLGLNLIMPRNSLFKHSVTDNILQPHLSVNLAAVNGVRRSGLGQNRNRNRQCTINAKKEM